MWIYTLNSFLRVIMHYSGGAYILCFHPIVCNMNFRKLSSMLFYWPSLSNLIYYWKLNSMSFYWSFEVAWFIITKICKNGTILQLLKNFVLEWSPFLVEMLTKPCESIDWLDKRLSLQFFFKFTRLLAVIMQRMDEMPNGWV